MITKIPHLKLLEERFGPISEICVSRLVCEDGRVAEAFVTFRRDTDWYQLLLGHYRGNVWTVAVHGGTLLGELVCPAEARKVARKVAIKKRPYHSRVLQFQALERHSEGESVRQIAESLGVGKSTVWDWLKTWSNEQPQGTPVPAPKRAAGFRQNRE